MLKWMAQHGPTLGTIIAASVGIYMATTKLDSKVAQVAQNQATIAENVGIQLDGHSNLLDAKLQPIQDATEEVQRELEILKTDVEGMSLAAEVGAEERNRRLAGKVEAVQQVVANVATTQAAVVETLVVVQVDLQQIHHELAVRDTVAATHADTVFVEKEQGWLRKLSPFH